MIHGVIRAFRSGFGAVARRPWAAALLCASLSFVGSCAYAFLVKWPQPFIHDEFSYILQADTFLQGRLTNPPHPMWRFFESFHIIHQPTYASKYPPAQAAVLAAGWWLGGNPAVGLWVGGALMTMAIWWMLRGFLPPRWALAGALMTAASFGTTSYWTQSFWGGCVPAAAGALFIGSLPRICRLGRIRDSVVLGLGLAALANSRPFEGLLVAIPAGLVLLAEAIRRVRTRGMPSLLRLVVPPVAVLVPVFAWMAYYNHTVTGDALRLPYVEHESQYAVAPPMVWLPTRPFPTYRHETIREFWTGTNLADYTTQREQFLAKLPGRVNVLVKFFFGPCVQVGFARVPLLSVALLGLPWLLRRRWTWLALATVAIIAAATLGETYPLAHYASPALGWLVLILIGGFRELFHVRLRAAPVEAAVVTVVLIIALLHPVKAILFPRPIKKLWTRNDVVAQLSADGQKHLAIVRYAPDHSTHEEWVANAAEIDEAPIVWARDMGVDENRPLLDYFEDRRIWLLEIGAPRAPIRFTPYPR